MIDDDERFRFLKTSRHDFSTWRHYVSYRDQHCNGSAELAHSQYGVQVLSMVLSLKEVSRIAVFRHVNSLLNPFDRRAV